MPIWGPVHRSLLVLLCFTAQSLAFAADDTRPLSLAHLTTENGLPQGTVYATLQDSQGFAWFATEDGLVRYDGRELTRYAYARDKTDGLPGNFIRQIIEDRRGDLWIAIKDGGLSRWNRATDTFTNFRHDPANKNSLASDSLRALHIDAQGRLWIGHANAGVDIFDLATQSFSRLRKQDKRLVDDRVRTIIADRTGAIWVGTEAGITRIETDGGARHLTGISNVSVIQEIRNGQIWVGSFDNGLTVLDRDGRIRQTLRHDSAKPASLANNDVRAVLQDGAGRVWVGTAGGLDLYSPLSGDFSHYRHDKSDSGSLRDSFVMSLYEDSTRLLWIGTRAGGVSRWNPRSWEFGGHRPGWLNDALVTSFADANNGELWVGSLGGGLTKINLTTGAAQQFDRLLGQRNALGDNRVMALATDSSGNLWIGTMANGLKKLARDGRVTSIPVAPGAPKATSSAGIMTLFVSRDGRLWVGTYGGGANVLEPGSGEIRQLTSVGTNVSAFAEDASGNMWIASTDGGGLYLARPDGQIVKRFGHDARDTASLASNTVYALAIDSRNRLWIGTDGGGLSVAVGDSNRPDEIVFRNFTRAEGLSSDTIYGILPDAAGQIWLSGNAGLMRLDPESNAVKTYHREHGLQGEEFNFNAYFRSRNGLFCFGGPGGFNAFDPAALTENQHSPRVVLTRFEVQGAPVQSNRPYWLLDRVAVPHDASIVSLNFAALDFTSPDRNRFAYRMRGLTEDWIDLGNQNRVTLTNLADGEHVLEVRAANADSVWSESPVRIQIAKAAPWWRTPGAYLVYGLLVAALLLWRLQQQQRLSRAAVDARQRLEAEVTARTQELRESNRLLEEAAQAKEGFMARMSHELRTPMNGVIGMTDLLSRTELSATQERYARTIRDSAQTLLHILNDLLDISKIRSGKIQLEAAPILMSQLLDDCALLFAGACQEKGLELLVEHPEPRNLRVIGDPLRIRQILMNLLGNAVKFTSKGSITVRGKLTIRSADLATTCIEVIDTGIGIDPKVSSKIFEPFTQADETTARRFGGTGLGLTICRELAALMGGTIGLDSQPGRGTTFRVLLPLPLVAADMPRIARLRDGSSNPRSMERKAAADGAPLANSRPRVLVVEDDPINATVADGYLQALGCDCVWVADGAAALTRIEAEKFDLVFMDLNMPGIDGFAATNSIRQRLADEPRVPIIALTAHDASSYRERCLAAGMDDILSKPYTLAACEKVVRHWLPDRSTDLTIEPDLTAVDAASVASIASLGSSRQLDLHARLIGLFEQSAADRLRDLASSLAADNLVEAAAVCHKLKSAAANVGAIPFSNLVREAEALCNQGEAARARQISERLAVALPGLLTALKSGAWRASA